MKSLSLFIAILLLNSNILFSQVAINTDGSTPDNSAILDIKSSNKGVLIPRLTFDQLNAFSNPADGLIVFCIDCGAEGSLSVYSNGTWKTFKSCSSSAPGEGVHLVLTGQIIWNWNAVSGATGYKWNTINNFGSAVNMGTSRSKTETGIAGNTDYTRYVWSYNACSNSQATVLTETTFDAPPVAPTAGTHIASWNQIIWDWNPSVDATGYKWNTVNNYASAIDLNSLTSKTETGLNCGTAYTRYAWAYNGYGPSASVTLTQSTLTCSTCGSSFSINHVAGPVAPVTKTVSYGTVSNVPGEPSKCWITKNLGAGTQATAVNDATQASAGWYWQFNRMQGYKHDGTTRTPNTGWIIDISESSNWILANDPCAIELGTGWRVPTRFEWENIDAAGNWMIWTGPWNSVLKMHAAGQLHSSNGSLSLRGSNGLYHSSTQSLSNSDWRLSFSVTACAVATTAKAYGFPLRCVRD